MLPTQTGLVPEATGVIGVEFTVAFTVPAILEQPFTVIISEYVPLAALVAPGMLGFCAADENPFGPLHEYVAPTTALVVKFSVCPTQTGLFVPGAGVAGIGLTVTLTVPALLTQPLTVTVTEYVPLAAVVAPTMLGFCCVSVKLFGPVHA